MRACWNVPTAPVSSDSCLFSRARAEAQHATGLDLFLDTRVIEGKDEARAMAALKEALAMPGAEQRDRMRSMRGLVQEFNVYRWAGRMLLDAGQMRTRSRLFARADRARKPVPLRSV